MTKGDKIFHIIFIDNYLKSSKLFLLRTKDKTCDIFLKYNVRVENQLNKKIKRLRIE